MLAILSGCSGVGKNTIINELLNNSEQYELMATYTTRDMRDNESEGKPYHFITKEDFERRIAEGEFYEYENVHGNYYGTSRKLLQAKKNSSRVLLKDIDVKGTQNLVKIAKDDIRIVTFFLKVKDRDVLIERLTGRGEQNIDLRLSRYDLEMEYINQYDYIIENNQLEETVGWMESILHSEQENQEIQVSAGFQGLDEQLVADYVCLLNSGATLEHVIVTANKNGVFICEGYERFVAGVIAGHKVPMLVTAGECIPADSEVANAWAEALEHAVSCIAKG